MGHQVISWRGLARRLAWPRQLLLAILVVLATQVGMLASGTPQVAMAVAVLGHPIGVVDPSGLLYITSNDNASMAVYNETTHELKGNYPVGSKPYGIDVNFTTNRIYVANSGANTISALDATTYAPTFTVSSHGSTPHGVAVDHQRNVVAVTNYNSNNVVFIDGTAGAPLASVSTPANPEAVASDATLGQFYTANSTGQSVTVIGYTSPPASDEDEPDDDDAPSTPTTRVNTVSLAGWLPQAIAADPVSHRVFVAAASASNPTSANGRLFLLDGASTGSPGKVVSYAPVGINPHGVSFANGRVLVTNYGQGNGSSSGDHSFTLLTYSDSTYSALVSTRRVPSPYRPFGVTFSPSVGDFFSVNQDNTGDGGSISEIDQAGNVKYTGGDYTPPTVTFDPPTTSTVSGGATDNASGVASVNVTFNNTSDRAPLTTPATLNCSDSSNLSCTWSAPQPPRTTPGQYSYTVTAVDRVGNSSTTKSPYGFTVTPEVHGTVDGSIPAPTVDRACTPPTTSAVLVRGQGQVCGSISVSGGTVAITLTYAPQDGIGTGFQQTVSGWGTGSWQITVDPSVAPGSYKVTATATAFGVTTPLSGDITTSVVA